MMRYFIIIPLLVQILCMIVFLVFNLNVFPNTFVSSTFWLVSIVLFIVTTTLTIIFSLSNRKVFLIWKCIAPCIILASIFNLGLAYSKVSQNINTYNDFLENIPMMLDAHIEERIKTFSDEDQTFFRNNFLCSVNNIYLDDVSEAYTSQQYELSMELDDKLTLGEQVQRIDPNVFINFYFQKCLKDFIFNNKKTLLKDDIMDRYETIFK